MPFNRKSLDNLGKPKTKAGRKNFTLTEGTIRWLAAQSNASSAIDRLVGKQIMIERLAQWLAEVVKIPRNDDDAGNVIIWSTLTMRDVWTMRGEDVESWVKMYGDATADETLHRLHHWVGRRVSGQAFWERNAIAILADPDIAYLVHPWSGEKFVISDGEEIRVH